MNYSNSKIFGAVSPHPIHVPRVKSRCFMKKLALIKSKSFSLMVQSNLLPALAILLATTLGNFEWLARAQTLQTLYSFQGADGAEPRAGVVQGNDGNFYGTTVYGGTADMGTAFKITPAGFLTTLVSFTNDNGANPYAGLVQGADGSFYGTTPNGGTVGAGTVFKIASTGALTTLVNFVYTNGSRPFAELVQVSDVNFYGTTYGQSGTGTLFRMTTNGAITLLVSAESSDSPLVQGTNGDFYGTTPSGGPTADGTVFKLTSNGVVTTLASFNYSSVYLPAQPEAGLVQGNDGNFYGTTASGGLTASPQGFGSVDAGTVFKITPDGVKTILASFENTNGAVPLAELVQGSDGNFYGTTLSGGAGYDYFQGEYGFGTIFKMTPSGTLTTLFSFSKTNGAYPEAKLLFGSDGNLYGTTSGGGSNNLGTIFRFLIPGAPSLNIARSNTSVVVSWSVTDLPFQLQQSTNLALPNAWSPVAQATVTNAGQISVTVPTTARQMFFRLTSP
jgi:uncharacterized repeat protein (TIGR03803 family)